MLGLIEPGELGAPKYRLSSRGGTLRLQVEAIGRGARAKLRSALQRRLNTSIEGLADWPLRVEFTSLPDVRFKP